jgi:hypothetical protein
MPPATFGHCTVVAALLSSAIFTAPAIAQTGETIRLVVDEGTPLRAVLDRRVIIKRVGQQIEAVLVDPIFAYDRIVIPAGSRVLGHVERRTGVSKKRRALAMLSGDFTPLHDVLLQFDSVELPDGRTLSVQTQVSRGTGAVTLKIAGGAEKKSNIISRAAAEAAQEAKQTVAMAKGPNKGDRVKDAALRALPYHPEFFSKGTIFNARLLSPLDFGVGEPTPSAAPGSLPAPESILSARLLTAIDSARSSKDGPVDAVITRPVFSTARELIVPAGTKLSGHITYVKPARHFRRNGQLRFLFESIHVPQQPSSTLLASLYSVQAGQSDRVSVDEEGGTKATNSPTRFIAPTLGALALVGLSQGRLDYDTDGMGPEMDYGGPVSGSVGGFVGASVTGVAISSLGYPAALTLGVLGVARTTYSSVFAKGKEVVFPADTRIQVQLAPK